MNKKYVLAAVSAGLSITATTSAAQASCGSQPDSNATDKGNYLCEDCVPLDGGVAGTAALFIKSQVNPHVDRWRPGDIIVITNGTIWRRYNYAPMYGTWYPTNGGSGVGPGEPRNHNGSGTLCADLEGDQNNGGGSSGGSADNGGSVFSVGSDALADYWTYYDLGMLPDPSVPNGVVYVEPVNYDAYWSNYYSSLYSDPNNCAYC